MNIKLQKSLAVFDIEATGLSVTQDRILEIAVLKINPDGSKEEYLQRVNPEMPIPAESTKIHGITDEDVAQEPIFSAIAKSLMEFIGDSDLGGFNSNKFDLPMLAEELLRANIEVDLALRKHIDVQNIFHKMEQRNLVAAYKFYCEKDLTNAHTAMADAEATWEVLDAQIARYDTLDSDVNFLADFSKYEDVTRVDFAGRLALNDSGRIIYNFGKHKGNTVEEVMRIEPGYCGWLLDADFPLYTKQCLRKEMKRIKDASKKATTNQDNNANIDDKLNALKNKFNKR